MLEERAKNFEVPIADKLSAQERARDRIIPLLAGSDYDSERVLKILHYASTWNATDEDRPSKFETYRTIAGRAGLLDNISPKNVRKTVFGYVDNGIDGVSIDFPHQKGRGNYRKLAHVDSDRGSFDLWRPRYTIIHTRAGDLTYVAPDLGVDLLMNSLCNNYDEMQQAEQDSVDTAMNLAYFYTIGELMIHPFIDGNHRAFDRFLEYGFAKAGKNVQLPQDETGNIPVSERFRVWTTNNLVNFMSRIGLPLVRTGEDMKRVGEANYRSTLGLSLEAFINNKLTDPMANFYYAGTAGEILKWAGEPDEERIAELQAKAAEEGNFSVIHRPA